MGDRSRGREPHPCLILLRFIYSHAALCPVDDGELLFASDQICGAHVPGRLVDIHTDCSVGGIQRPVSGGITRGEEFSLGVGNPVSRPVRADPCLIAHGLGERMDESNPLVAYLPTGIERSRRRATPRRKESTPIAPPRAGRVPQRLDLWWVLDDCAVRHEQHPPQSVVGRVWHERLLRRFLADDSDADHWRTVAIQSEIVRSS